jgi:transposase
MLDSVGGVPYTLGMVNRLSTDKQKQILNLLVEGSSMRSISRVTGVSINTVTKLLVTTGEACAAFHDQAVRDVPSRKVQCDEVWSFCYAQRKNVEYAKAAPAEAGDVWTWTGIDADSKLIMSWHVSLSRDSDAAIEIMDDLRSRLANRVQITTDGLKSYLEAVEGAFGGDVDYAQLVKLYGPSPTEDARRYSPVECVGAVKHEVSGNPDWHHISTSYVERQNLTTRMGMRRFTRLTNAFSKKLENHCHMLALYFVHYNFCRPHTTLTKRANGYKTTPAMASGLAERMHDMDWLAELVNDAMPTPAKRGPYGPRKAAISN